MSSELTDKLTPIAPSELLHALHGAWELLYHEHPHPASLLVLIAHWALETGWGKSCHCFNLGNVKASGVDGRDFCYFECGEEVAQARVDAERAKWGDLIQIKRAYTNSQGLRMASIIVLPKHPWSRFRAFANLDDAALDYLLLLRSRFDKAWQAVIAGDPGVFVDKLKAAGYFTANIEPYRSSVVSIFKGLVKTLGPEADQLDAEPAAPAAPTDLDAAARARLFGMVAESLDDVAREIAEAEHPRPSEDEA